MGTGLGDLQRKADLDALFDTAHLYLSAWVLDPGVDGQSGTEASGTSYAVIDSVPADWNAATTANPSVVTNANDLAFPEAGGSWSSGSTHTHIAIWKHATTRTAAMFAGRMLIGGGGKVVATGETLRFPAGSLSMSTAATV